MIKEIGYTEDGRVWAKINMEVETKPCTGLLILDPTTARQVADSLNESADQAEKSVQKGVLQ